MKPTMRTVKAFVSKNRPALLISLRRSFDAMTDGMEYHSDKDFHPVQESGHVEHTLGIQGAWFVGGAGRNYIRPYDDGRVQGFEISNCCAGFVLAVAK